MKKITQEDILEVLTGKRENPKCPKCETEEVELDLLSGDYYCKKCKGAFNFKQTDKFFKNLEVIEKRIKQSDEGKALFKALEEFKDKAKRESSN